MRPVLRTALNAFILFSLLIFVHAQDDDDDYDDGGIFILPVDSYSSYFEEYKNYSILIPGKKTFENIHTRERCAKKCYRNPTIDCRSFQFCKLKKTCTLYEEHVLNLKVGVEVKTNIDTDCGLNSFWESLYFRDFYIRSSNCIEKSSFTAVNKNVNTKAIECGQECYFMKEKCNSFNYYDLTKESDSADFIKCAFSVLKPSSSNQAENTPHCFNYEKLDKPIDNRLKPYYPGGDDDQGSNQRTTIIIVCVVLGIAVVAAIAVFFVLRHRKNRGTSSRPN